MKIVLRISIIIPVAIQILRTPIPHQPRLPVVITGNEVIVRRRSPRQRNQRSIQRPGTSQDARCLDGAPDAICFAATHKRINGALHQWFQRLPISSRNTADVVACVRVAHGEREHTARRRR